MKWLKLFCILLKLVQTCYNLSELVGIRISASNFGLGIRPRISASTSQKRDAKDGGYNVETALAVADAGVAVLHLVFRGRPVTLLTSALVLSLVVVVLRVAGPRGRLLADQRRVGAGVSGNTRNLKL